jgi:hypothetical protein
VIAGAAVSAAPDQPQRAVGKALSFDRRSTGVWLQPRLDAVAAVDMRAAPARLARR